MASISQKVKVAKLANKRNYSKLREIMVSKRK